MQISKSERLAIARTRLRHHYREASRRRAVKLIAAMSALAALPGNDPIADSPAFQTALRALCDLAPQLRPDAAPTQNEGASQ